MKETVISRAELAKLPEYSCSLPTGTTIGKRWRRDVHFNKPPAGRPAPEWCIGEYFDDGTPGMVAIRWTWAVDEQRNVHRGDPRGHELTEASRG